ncbi:hypothetical protein V6B14_22465 (plasmid) [Sporosarcina psychrophila]|uniref:hypothetical protein n=1 Tax=Sporosarcina psychrophila TaxID=1476 RepID=UPI0030D296ED
MFGYCSCSGCRTVVDDGSIRNGIYLCQDCLIPEQEPAEEITLEMDEEQFTHNTIKI